MPLEITEITNCKYEKICTLKAKAVVAERRETWEKMSPFCDGWHSLGCLDIGPEIRPCDFSTCPHLKEGL